MLTETQLWYKEHGICIDCGQEKVWHNSPRCRICLAKRADYARIYRETHKMTEEQRQKHNAKVRERKKRLKENGVCVQCGKRKVTGNHISCDYCLAKDRRKARQKADKQGKIPSFMRGNGYCSLCLKPVPNNEKQCERCKENSRKSLAYARTFITKEHRREWIGVEYSEAKNNRR